VHAAEDGMQTVGPLSGYRVLVVEDDADSRDAIRLTLEASGANVVAAASASEALAALAARPCDIVVSDLAMPEQSGFWLITKIRQLFPRRHVPVIAVTGHPFPSDGVLRAGFDDVMQKPPDPDALCAAVASLLSARDTPGPIDG
jgi:two-component system OmpR family response regulator